MIDLLPPIQITIPLLYLIIATIFFDAALHSPPMYRHSRNGIIYMTGYLCFSALAFYNTRYLALYPVLRMICPQAIVFNVLHGIAVLWIAKMPAPPYSLAAKSELDTRLSKIGQRLQTTWLVWSNPRRVGWDAQICQWTPTTQGIPERKRAFMIRRIFKLLCIYVVYNYGIPAMEKVLVYEISSADVAGGQQTLHLLFRLSAMTTTRSLRVRAMIMVRWVLQSVLVCDACAISISLCSVGVRLDRPSDWSQPLFGSVADIVSLRRFWSHFWHQLAYRPHRDWACLIAGPRGLRINEQTLLYRGTIPFVMFGISAASHAFVAWHLQMAQWHLEGIWYMMCFGGCMLEVLASLAIRSLAKRLKISNEVNRLCCSYAGKAAGFAWLVFFFTWSLPITHFEFMERQALYRERTRRYYQLRADRVLREL